MKKWLLTLALLVTFSGAAQNFQEGTHYSRLANPQPTASPAITEYFSFFCRFCYRFSTTTAPMLKQTLPDSITFRQVHTAVPNHVTETLAKAYILAEHLGKEQQLESTIFNAIHEKKQRPTNADDVKALVLAAGIPAAQYKQINAFTVNATLSKHKAEIKKVDVTFIPDFIVNGRYRIHRSALKSDDELIKLIQYLAKK